MLFNFFTKKKIVFFSLKILFLSQLSTAEVITLDSIYLIVNSQMVTRSEAIDFLTNFKSQFNSTKQSKDQFQREFLMNLIQELLLLDRANALKINPNNKEIDKRFEVLSDKQPKILDIYNEEDLREQIAREFKKHRVINLETSSKIHIESNEIINFCYQQSKKNRKVGLSQILLEGSANQVREKVKKINRDFNDGMKFGELAKIYSIDKKAIVTAGKLGLFKTTDLLPEIREIVNNLEPGKISNLVQTNLGNHLFYIYREVYTNEVNCENLNKDKETKYSNSLYNQKRNLLLDKFLNDLYVCANIELKEPGNSGLPGSVFLDSFEKNGVNCHDRRSMILPKKKEKTNPIR